MYSDISTRIISSSFPKSASASAFESSVLPTPVGPRNRKEPIGLFGSFRPTLPLLTAFARAFTASSWPMTLFSSVFSNFPSLAVSVSFSLLNGILVQAEITSATSSSVTDTFLFSWLFSNRAFACSSFFMVSFCSRWRREASSMFPVLIQFSFSAPRSL